MQETRYNCFGSKKRSTTLLQAKTGRLLLHFGTRVYLFSPEEGSCYVFLTRNNCCEFLTFFGVITQSVIQSFLKTPVCGASLSILTCLNWIKLCKIDTFLKIQNSMFLIENSIISINDSCINGYTKEFRCATDCALKWFEAHSTYTFLKSRNVFQYAMCCIYPTLTKYKVVKYIDFY